MSKITETLYDGWIFDDLLTPTQCSHYRNLVDNLAKGAENFQSIQILPDISNSIWNIIKNIIPQYIGKNGYKFKLVSISPHVTLSKHTTKPIGIHKDEDIKTSNPNEFCPYKLCIYLNDLSQPLNHNDTTGGTYFYNNDKKILYKAKPKLGRGVLFDMREWHSGSPIPPNSIKYLIGVRPIYQQLF